MFDSTTAPDTSHTAAAERLLTESITRLWSRGWTPTEVVRTADTLFDRAMGDVAAIAIAVERRNNPAGAGADWLALLDQVGKRAPARNLDEYLSVTGDAPWQFFNRAETLTAVLDDLPRMAFVCDPPGMTVMGSGTKARPVDTARVLERIRAILAKAEASDFPDEAATFTAKAQEMMSKHSIERAMLDDPEGVAPAAIRIWHEAPYASAKGDLLASIAGANGCRTVSMGQLHVSTVFGFRHDLDAVELLHTSLLVQAVAEMAYLERQWQHDRSRIRSFRHSFLVGFAGRVGQRLREIRSAAATEAAESSNALPVLASRDAAVDRMVDEVFPRLTSRRRSVSNSAGYRAGTIAADKADLGTGSSLNRG